MGRTLLQNLIYNWAAVGARRRNELAAAGQWVPSFVVMSPTMRCNLKCTGCYSGLYTKRGELVPAGHEHSEDMVQDPWVVAWADEYSARLKTLTDPRWEAQLSDPADRWYREKHEYRNLFRFKEEKQEGRG